MNTLKHASDLYRVFLVTQHHGREHIPWLVEAGKVAYTISNGKGADSEEATKLFDKIDATYIKKYGVSIKSTWSLGK